MAIVILIELEPREDAMGELLNMLTTLLPQTRAHEGCLSLEAYRVMGDPVRIVLIQRWSSIEQYQEYFEWRARSGVLERMRDLLKASPTARHLRPIEV